MEIGSVYARLSANIDNFQRNLKKAGSDLDTFAGKAGGVGKKMQSVGGNMGELVGKSLPALGRGLQVAGGFIGDMVGKVMNLTKVVGIGLLGAFTAVSAYGLKMGNSIQQTAIAFDTMLGDPDKRRKLMQEITDFAKKTPFERFELIDASKLLLAMGVSADAIIPSMEMLGNISAGVGANVKDVAFVFGQVRAQGQAYTEDLNQFATRGIPIYEELGKVLGISVAELRDGMGSGKIKVNFDTLNQAMRNLTAEGGKFYNLMDKQSRSLGGILSNLKDGFDNIILTFMGITSEGDVKSGSFFDLATQKATQFQEWLSANEELIGQWGSRVFGAIASGMNTAWDQGISPTLQEFQNWFNNGGKESIKAFIREGWVMLQKAFVYFQQEIWPSVKESLKELMDYMASPQFQTDLQTVAGIIRDIATAVGEVGKAIQDTAPALSDLVEEKGVMSAFNPINQIKIGMAGINGLRNRESGGPVNAGQMYEVGENNKAEMLMMNGKQYMIPGNNGQVLNQSQMGSGGNTFNITGANPMEIARQVERVLARQNNLARNGINV